VTGGTGDGIEFKGPVTAHNVLGKGTLNDHSTHLHFHGAASPVALRSLPRGPGRLVGRDDQVNALLELLRPGGTEASPVVVSAVAGLAGVGKTALVLHVAHQATAQGWFPGGTVFMDLHGYDGSNAPVDPGHALGSLLRALGTSDRDIPPDTESQAALYRSLLADLADKGRPVLLVLDNTSTAAAVHPLLPGGSEHRVLITSRDTLAALPDVRLLDLDTLAPHHATALITTALHTARPDDARPQREPAELDRIAHLCGYLPLALQITAALLKADPQRRLATLASELDDTRTRLGTLSYPDHTGSQLAVRTAFHLSYRRLDPEQTRTFRLLSLCQGPDVGVAAVAALTGTNSPEAAGQMSALARAHLIEPTAEDRWRTHDLIHLYAAELSRQTDDDETRGQALDLLIGYYTRTAYAADDHLRALPGDRVPDRFKDRADALDWFDRERPNLVAATAQAAATDRHHATLSLASYQVEYLHWRRRFEDAVTTGELAVQAARQFGDRRSEGTALNNLGSALCSVRRFEEAIAAHLMATEIYRETGDRRGEGSALNNLGLVLLEVRRFDEAIAAHQGDLAICRESGDRHGEGAALNNLGSVLLEVRRFDEAISSHQQAADIFRESGDRHGEGAALNNLGSVLLEVRRFDEAISSHQQAAAIYRETGDRHGEGSALHNLGSGLRHVRRFEEAITAHEQAAEIYREAVDRHSEGLVLNNLGLALREVRRFEEAITVHQQAAGIYQETGDRNSLGVALNNLGLVLLEVRRFGEAGTVLQQAAGIYRESGDRHGEGKALNNLGSARRHMGWSEEAITAHEQAAEIFRESGDRHGEGTVLNNLGSAQLELRRFEEAMTTLQQALEIHRETGDRHGEGMVLNNLGLAARCLGRFDEAIAAHLEDLAICHESDDRHGEGMALNSLGSVLREAQRFEEAVAVLVQAADIFGETGDSHRRLRVLTEVADMLASAKAQKRGLRGLWRRARSTGDSPTRR